MGYFHGTDIWIKRLSCSDLNRLIQYWHNKGVICWSLVVSAGLSLKPVAETRKKYYFSYKVTTDNYKTTSRNKTSYYIANLRTLSLTQRILFTNKILKSYANKKISQININPYFTYKNLTFLSHRFYIYIWWINMKFISKIYRTLCRIICKNLII